MNKHVQELLYDYLRRELPATEHKAVEEHLQHCPACTTAKRDMEEAIGMVDEISPIRHGRPSAMRSEEFWNTFAARVDARLDRPTPRRLGLLAGLAERLSWKARVHRSAFGVAGGALAAAVVLLIFLLSGPPSPDPSELIVSGDSAGGQSVQLEPYVDGEPALPHDEETETRTAESRATVRPVFQQAGGRVGQYLRKSKMLLIGIVNMDTDAPGDLTVERRASRQLIQEARYLRERPLDRRTAGLVDELDRILIQLAAIAEEKQTPDVELLRGGIRQENLLFKIRMAEVALDTSQSATRTRTF